MINKSVYLDIKKIQKTKTLNFPNKDVENKYKAWIFKLR